MGFLHSSRTRGRLPASLKLAADVRFIRFSGGNDETTRLTFEVAEFGSVAEELFKQGLLWEEGPKPTDTAFELFAAIVGDIRAGARDSTRFDHPLLHRVAGYGRMLKGGLESIGFPDVRTAPNARIDGDVSRTAEALYRETPPPQRVRLTGRLDVLGVSKRVLGIELESGARITAVWALEKITNLAPFLDQRVVVEGLAAFRPSGTLLRVDADAIAEATATDAFFSAIPHAEPRIAGVHAASRVAEGKSAYAALFGCLGAEESDEAFVDAVAELD